MTNTAAATRKKRQDAYVAEARKLFHALAGCKAKEVAKDLQAADCFRQDALQDNEDAQDVLRKLKRTALDKNRPSLLKQWSNAKAALQRKISMGGPRLRSSDDRRPLTPEEIASKQVGQRQLTAQELKDQKILVSDCWSEEQLAQLQQELQEIVEVDAMPVPERTAAITHKLSVQMDRVQATTEQNAASLAHIVSHGACWFVLTQVQVTQTMLWCLLVYVGSNGAFVGGACWSMVIKVLHCFVMFAGRC